MIMVQDTWAAIWTVGHSNRSLQVFLDLLAAHGVEQVADVRRFPGSRRLPHFGGQALEQALAARGIGYRHWPALGGRRGRPAPDSPNDGWRVAQFAAYADYMQTAAFRQGLEQLTDAATAYRTAIMCAEAVPWRCHRRLVADALLVAGWQVYDIMGEQPARAHALTPFARCRADGSLVYPAD